MWPFVKNGLGVPRIMPVQVLSILAEDFFTQSLVVAASIQRAGQDELGQRPIPRGRVGATGGIIVKGCFNIGNGMTGHAGFFE